MKTYRCKCGVRLHFENSLCVSCRHELGFLPDARVLSALRPLDNGLYQAVHNDAVYRKCHNYEHFHVCNWMVPESDDHSLCFSCRLSEIIPDLSDPKNLELWGHVERAKRRLLYSLIWLGLPIVGRNADAQNGLAFHLMEDQGYSEFVQVMPMEEQVITGHSNGVITLNIAEADPVSREQSRTRMQEAYRTLLGHFRHESGHYYWDRLLRDSSRLNDFRGLFGDERHDYDSKLQAYYTNGPAPGWQARWISAYASAHPWEDWAETWAHYLHMIDTLETACDYSFDVCDTGARVASHPQFSVEYLSTISIFDLVNEWSNLSVALNDMNRSMGLADAYPFILTNIVIEKLAFVHDTVIAAS